jgi:hypothetical protein
MFRYFVSLFSLSFVSLVAHTILNSAPAIAQSALPIASLTPTAIESFQSPNSYIGIGGVIGVNGNTTSLGSGGLTVVSKLRFTDNISLHDATVLFGREAATSMIILSADFPIRNSEGKTIVAPFIGGGAQLRYAEGLFLSPAVSAGIDIPMSNNFTGTVRLNAGFPSNRNADIGVIIGAGYSFGR